MAKGGNPAMRSKRVTGPTPNTVLLMHVRMERCSVKGCENPPVYTKNPDGTTRIRRCADHLDNVNLRKSGKQNVRALLKLPWE